MIHFLHSYINPAHESRALAIAHELWPNPYVTAGHLILSEYREYERGVTAAVNASVLPVRLGGGAANHSHRCKP